MNTSRAGRAAMIFAALLLTACGVGEEATTVRLDSDLLGGDVDVDVGGPRGALVVGFDRRLDLETDVRQIASLARWMEERSGVALRPDVDGNNGGVTAARLCSGELDLAAAGTVAYLQAHELCGARMLVRGVSAEGLGEYRAAIIADRDSGIETVRDLAGRRFAFGYVTSTQGHLIPHLMLREAGLDKERLATVLHAGSHAEAAGMVIDGTVDAAAVQDTLARDLADQRVVDIVVLSDPYPASGIVVGPGVPEGAVRQLRTALLELDPAARDAEALHRWGRTEMPRGFIPARDDDYDELRGIARELDLLGTR